jgi:hypothetical protein
LTEKIEEIPLCTFGTDKPMIIKAPVITLHLLLKDGSHLTVTANVVPKITGTVYRMPINEEISQNWDYLWKDIPLADSLPREVEASTIELLIGNDYYLDLLLPQKIEVTPGLYLLGSRLGWILTGRMKGDFEQQTEPTMLILTHGSSLKPESALLTFPDYSLPFKENLEHFRNLETTTGIKDSYQESVINTRPLVYVGDDINSGITLTPADFMKLNPTIGIPEDQEEDDGNDDGYQPRLTSTDKLLRTWKKGQRHLNMFWKTWRDDYLLSLRERTQTNLRGPRCQALVKAKTGDVVLVKDNLPRGAWKLGRIVNLITSKDGEVRAATVMLKSHKTIRRPLKLLYPIECPDQMDDEEQPRLEEVKTEDATRRLPLRQAAVEARKRLRLQLNCASEVVHPL